MADLPPLATVDQLAVRLGYPLEGAEADRARALLIEASELIRDAAGTDWVDEGGQLSDVPRRVAQICLAATYRAFTNPEALSQRSIGDSSKSYDRAGVEGGEAVYLTTAEREAVLNAAGRSPFAAVTLVSPYSGDSMESLIGS